MQKAFVLQFLSRLIHGCIHLKIWQTFILVCQVVIQNWFWGHPSRTSLKFSNFQSPLPPLAIPLIPWKSPFFEPPPSPFRVTSFINDPFHVCHIFKWMRPCINLERFAVQMLSATYKTMFYLSYARQSLMPYIVVSFCLCLQIVPLVVIFCCFT